MIIETRKLTEAIRFTKAVTEGHDPKPGRSCEDFLNDPDTIRNMYFIQTILSEINEGNLICRNRSPFPYDILDEFRYEKDQGIKSLLSQIYSPLAHENVHTLTPQMVGSWLRDEGYLTMQYDSDYMSNVAMPTDEGRKLGLYSQIRIYQGRRFPQVIYSQAAQEFIVSHFREIMDASKLK